MDTSNNSTNGNPELARTPVKDVVLKALSIFGGIAVLIAIVWVGVLGFRKLPNIGDALAGVFGGVQSIFKPAERIVVSTVDSQIVINEEFTLSWEHRGKQEGGSYTFFYECSDGVHFAVKRDGVSSTVFCNTPLNILESDTRLSVTPIGNISGDVDVPVSIRFTENNESEVSLEGTLIVRVQDSRFTTGQATTTPGDVSTSTDNSDDTPVITRTPTNTTTPRPTTQPVTPPREIVQFGTQNGVRQPISDPNGKADLVVKVLAIGTVNADSGKFTERDEIPLNGRGAIRFEVRNDGTKESGRWEFEAELPTSPSYTYNSKTQQTLFPGDRIEFIIGFDEIKRANEVDYEIFVDSEKDVSESNERNNTVTGQIEVDR